MHEVSDYEGVVLTGASGALGREIAKALQGSGVPLYSIFSSQKSLERNARPELQSSGGQSVVADLRSDSGTEGLRAALPAPGAKLLFIHAAADVSWTKSYEAIVELNVGGTRRLAALAVEYATNKPASFVYLSTAFAHRKGGEYLNAYERSKAESEQILSSNYEGRLQVGVVRPTLIVGATRTGVIERFNGMYPLLRVVAYSEVPCLVGDPLYKLNVVPVDWVARETLAAAKTLNHAAIPPRTLAAADGGVTLADFLDLAQTRLRFFRKAWGAPPRGDVTIIQRRQFDFLLRAATSWNLDAKFEQVRRISDVMSGYLGQSQDLSPIVASNYSVNPPDTVQYLQPAIDYWILQNRQKVTDVKRPSWEVEDGG